MIPQKCSLPVSGGPRLGPGLNLDQPRLPDVHDRRMTGNSRTVAHVKVPYTNSSDGSPSHGTSYT